MDSSTKPTGAFSSEPGDRFQGPLHARVERELRRTIALPEYQHGALLPPELTLANRFGVSRATVRCAILRLVDKGLLERKAGVGTRVRPTPGESSLAAWQSFSHDMKRRNIIAESYLQQVAHVAAPVNVALALQIEPETSVLQMERVRGWDKLPVLQSRSWFHPRLRLPEDADFSKPLYELVEELTGAVADSAREELTAVFASDVLAKRLETPLGEPLVLRCHTVYDTGRRPIEFAEVHYVSSRFTLTLDLRRDSVTSW